MRWGVCDTPLDDPNDEEREKAKQMHHPPVSHRLFDDEDGDCDV